MRSPSCARSRREQLKLNMISMRTATYVGGPVVDGKLDLGAPTTLYAEGKGARVPVIVGANSADIGFAQGKTLDELFAELRPRCAQSPCGLQPGQQHGFQGRLGQSRAATRG